MGASSCARGAAAVCIGLVALLLSCVNPEGPTTISGDNAEETGIFWQDGFEAAFPASTWTRVGIQAAIAQGSASVHAGAQALVFDAVEIGTGQSATLSMDLTLAKAANLRFWLRTDIGSDIATDFSLEVDGVAIGTWTGLQGTWTAVDRLIPAGSHSLGWKLSRTSNLYYPSATNCVYLDDVSLCEDTAASLSIDSAAPQEVVMGGSLSYSASVLRADGSAKTGQAATWELIGGSGSAAMGSDGLLSATSAGSLGVRAVSGQLASPTAEVTILPADHLDLPLVHAGSMYEGRANDGLLQPWMDQASTVSVSSPVVSGFSADAFFTMRGHVTGSGSTQYACIYLKKTEGQTIQSTYVFVSGDFAQRIWLRFGKGDYTVTVYPINLLTTNQDYRGDITSWESLGAAWSCTVTNTRDEDGTSLYPSYALQADDLAIRNLCARLVFGKAGEDEKLLALHDYVVSTLSYDDSSLADGSRAKQDALSALSNGTAVCEGYTSLFGALARAAGFRVKAVAGIAAGGSHAWNLVEKAGAWSMVDCTWDDPGPNDADPTNLSHDYFLATSPNGDLGDHLVDDYRPGRGPGIAGLPAPAPFLLD